MESNAPGGEPRPGTPAPLTRWQKTKMVVKVVELRLRFVALMAATALVFAYWDTLWNYYDKWTRPEATRTAAAADAEYYCPMHPSVVRDEPGSCPICGMPLSKRKKGEREVLPPNVTARIQLAPKRIAQAGVRTVSVDYSPLAETITTVGYVTFDERRLARISSKTKGMARVEKLHVNFKGTKVEAGAPLAELYSAELYQAVNEALIAKRAAAAAPAARAGSSRSVLGDPSVLLEASREKLRLWGLTTAQIDQLLERGRAESTVTILAPIGGVVTEKNVVEGQYVSEGEALFEVADLDHVWIQAQVYEDQFALVSEGQKVTATVGAYPGRTFEGEVAFVDPVFDPATRTANVRYDLANPGHELRSGMFATVKLQTPMADLPAFRARFAERAGGRDLAHQASLTVDEQQECLVTNLKLGSMGDPVPVEVSGKKLWMCCPSCEEKLKGEPDRYLAKLAPPPAGGVLAVPESAVINTGDRTVVYVEAEPGIFEGRAVVFGPPSGDLYPVLEGLAPGEKIAAAGAFLIDAESRLNPAPQQEQEPAKPPAEAPPGDKPIPIQASAERPNAPHRH